jgi:(p)ppGpp synthase/HD superfamily hydrolase
MHKITNDLARALSLALDAHSTQMRKGSGTPYISHPLAVAAIAIEFGADEEQAKAALMHDTVEDGGQLYLERIHNEFGARVAAIVLGCTDCVGDTTGSKPPWLARKKNYLAHLESARHDVLLVCASDKLHNARSIVSDLQVTGLAVFDRFSATQEQTLWYYSSLADIFTRRDVAIAPSLNRAVLQMQALTSKLQGQKKSH